MFEAVEFLEEGEEEVLAREALERTDNGQQVISEEDLQHICENWDDLEDLGDYYLATAVTYVDQTNAVCMLCRFGSGWDVMWNFLHSKWGSNVLVLRSVPESD